MITELAEFLRVADDAARLPTSASSKGLLCACGHAWLLHDIEEHDGDGSDLCCVEGCDQAACPGRNQDKGSTPAAEGSGT